MATTEHNTVETHGTWGGLSGGDLLVLLAKRS